MRTLLDTTFGASPVSSKTLSSTMPFARMSSASRMVTGESATKVALPPAPAFAISDLKVIGVPAGSVAFTVSPSPAEIITWVSGPGTAPVDQLVVAVNEPVVPPIHTAMSVTQSQLRLLETLTLEVPA